MLIRLNKPFARFLFAFYKLTSTVLECSACYRRQVHVGRQDVKYNTGQNNEFGSNGVNKESGLAEMVQ